MRERLEAERRKSRVGGHASTSCMIVATRPGECAVEHLAIVTMRRAFDLSLVVVIQSLGPGGCGSMYLSNMTHAVSHDTVYVRSTF